MSAFLADQAMGPERRQSHQLQRGMSGTMEDLMNRMNPAAPRQARATTTALTQRKSPSRLQRISK